MATLEERVTAVEAEQRQIREEWDKIAPRYRIRVLREMREILERTT